MLEVIPVYELPFTSAQNPGFKIFKVGNSNKPASDVQHPTNSPHKHNYYEVCFFTKGTGEHDIDFVTYPIKTPSIHFLQPGQVHNIRRGENYRGYLLVLSEEFFNVHFRNLEIIPGYPLVTQLEDGPIINLEKEEFEEFNPLIQEIEKEYTSAEEDCDAVVAALLKAFFLRVRRKFIKISSRENETQASQSLAYKFNQLVEKHFTEIQSVQQYADMLGESPVLLSRNIKSLTGKTAGEIIIDRLILEAKRLLLFSELSNKEVAYKLGYDDPSYFARIFRRKTGHSPSAFREKMKDFYA